MVKNRKGYLVYSQESVLSESLAHKGLMEEILIVNHPVDGASGEVRIEWAQIGENLVSAVRIAFPYIKSVNKIIKVLEGVEGKNPTPRDVIEILEASGFKRLTTRVG